MVNYSVHYSVVHCTAHDLVSFKLDYWPHTTAGSESRTSDNVRFQYLFKKCCDYLTKSLTFFTTYNARKKIIQCTMYYVYSSDDSTVLTVLTGWLYCRTLVAFFIQVLLLVLPAMLAMAIGTFSIKQCQYVPLGIFFSFTPNACFFY